LGHPVDEFLSTNMLFESPTKTHVIDNNGQ